MTEALSRGLGALSGFFIFAQGIPTGLVSGRRNSVPVRPRVSYLVNEASGYGRHLFRGQSVGPAPRQGSDPADGEAGAPRSLH